MKNFCILVAILSFASVSYAANTTNLIDIQNNYQSAKDDTANKQNLVTKAHEDVDTAKNDLEEAQNKLQQAQKDLKTAQTNLQQKQKDLVKANQDLVISNQNLDKAKNAVNQAWKKDHSTN